MIGHIALRYYFASLVILLIAMQGPGAVAADVLPYKGLPLDRTSTADWDEGYGIQINEKKYDLTLIESLPAYQTTIMTPWDVSGTFIGVKFIDLLRHAGIKDFKRLLTRAANDYKITISSDDKGIDTALLAYRFQDSRLELNDKGPYWLIWPQQAEGLFTGEEPGTKWIWSVVEIRKTR